MGLIAITFFDTEENGRTKYSQEMLLSLYDTVDLQKHRVFLIDNDSCVATKKILSGFRKSTYNTTLITLKENIGTARGINLALSQRKEGEVCFKSDNDITWHQSGWVEELEQVFTDRPDIGICGLKRSDVWQNPSHENPAYRTHMEGNLEICDDIIGTCTAFNPLMLDKVGYMNQPSDYYGGDDVLFSARSLAAGFKNAFLPHIKITHLDDGGTTYTKWKQDEAGKYIGTITQLCESYQSGKLNYYYDGGF
jgi:GT2 family glycosyltransferase